MIYIIFFWFFRVEYIPQDLEYRELCSAFLVISTYPSLQSGFIANQKVELFYLFSK